MIVKLTADECTQDDWTTLYAPTSTPVFTGPDKQHAESIVAHSMLQTQTSRVSINFAHEKLQNFDHSQDGNLNLIRCGPESGI